MLAIKPLLVLLTILTISSTAHAIVEWAPCANDAKTHCPGLTLGSDEAAECLEKLPRDRSVWPESLVPKKENGALSQECASTVEHWQFHRYCKADIEKFCSNVEPGERRIHECIRKNAGKVNGLCLSFIREYLGVGTSHEMGHELAC
jgi:hypothetical protein